jgi:hypothetical protein
MTQRMILIAMVAALGLLASGCDFGTQRDRARPGNAAAVGVASAVSGGPHPRMPAGFEVAQGPRGVTELSVSDLPNDGLMFAYVTDGRPQDVAAYYERRAVANGMTITARMSAADLNAVNARRATGSPRTIAVNAVKKGDLTNVTVQFGNGDR